MAGIMERGRLSVDEAGRTIGRSMSAPRMLDARKDSKNNIKVDDGVSPA